MPAKAKYPARDVVPHKFKIPKTVVAVVRPGRPEGEVEAPPQGGEIPKISKIY